MKSLPPMTLYSRDYPELAAVGVLRANVELARDLLLASCPVPTTAPDRVPTSREAYASSIIAQLESLSILLDEYLECVKHLRALLYNPPPDDDEPTPEEIPL